MPKSTRERVANLRARRRAQGYALVQVWVHRDDKDRLKAYADKLRALRERDSQTQADSL